MLVNKWFTFDEVLNTAPYGLLKPEPNKTPADTQHENWFMNMLSLAGLCIQYAGIKSNGSRIKTADVNKYIAEVTSIVYDRQHDNYFLKVENVEDDYALTADDFKKAMNKFINVMNLTLPKYLPMIYEAEELYEDALKKLESESDSFSRYNDTPEDEQDETDFNTSAYASNMGRSKNVSKVDSGSPVARMEELRTKWKSIILEWSNDFDKLFIDEYQLGGF